MPVTEQEIVQRKPDQEIIKNIQVEKRIIVYNFTGMVHSLVSAIAQKIYTKNRCKAQRYINYLKKIKILRENQS